MLAVPSALLALDSVTVELRDAGGFTDFTMTDAGSEKELKELAGEWTAFVESEAVRRIRHPGSLSLVFTDIDMAGDFEPWGSIGDPDIRFFRSIYPPRLEFAYTLLDEEGGEVRSGEASVRDMNFELGRSPGYENELLYYEKAVMRGWRMQFDRDLGVADSSGGG